MNEPADWKDDDSKSVVIYRLIREANGTDVLVPPVFKERDRTFPQITWFFDARCLFCGYRVRDLAWGKVPVAVQSYIDRMIGPTPASITKDPLHED